MATLTYITSLASLKAKQTEVASIIDHAAIAYIATWVVTFPSIQEHVS